MPDASPSDGGAAAFEALRRAIEAQPHGSILLAGPASPARRRLLEALPARLGDDLESVWLEGGDLSPAAIWVRIATALGVTPGYDARRRVLHLLGDRVLRDGGLVVLAPEAETLAGDSLSSLMNNARTETGFHLVLAATSAGALAARLPEDATLIEWNGEPLGVIPPKPPSQEVGEAAAERIETHAAATTPSPARPASRPGRRSAALRGAALLLAAGLAFAFAWGLSRSRSREPAESELSATAVPSPAPEPERARPAPAPIPSATSSEAASAPAAEAPPSAAAAEPAPQPAEPSAGAEPRDVPAEITAMPPPEPEPAPSRESAAAPAAAPPPEPAAPPPEPVAPPPEPPRPSVAVAPTPPAPPAPPPLARGVLRVDSEVPVRIEIDGKPYGRTPLAGIRLSRGPHRIVARYPDGASALKSVTLGDEDVAVFYR